MAYTGATALGSPIVAWNAEDRTTLIYTSNEAGYFTAFSQTTHEPVWSIGFGGGLRSTPLVEGAFVWVAPTFAHRLYKLDAGTGAVRCSAPLPDNTDASATVATPPGGSQTIYIGVNDSGPNNGPFLGVNAANCRVVFSVTPEPLPGTGGVWDGASYAVDANGEGVVLFGTADPDAAVYAIDAITGRTVWRYATQNPPPGDYDVGAGVTVSPPGVNGFADGMVYAVNKDGYLDALDLTTGALIWTVQGQGSISTPALDGSDLIYGNGDSATCRDARTGSVIWTADTGSVIDGSVDIVGPPGSQVAVYGDMSGAIHVLSVTNGQSLYQYQTGNFIVSAVAEDDDNLITTSADGFLYDFTPGGGNGAAPTTAVTAPKSSSSVPNPDGDAAVVGKAGTASGPDVASVRVAIQEGGAAGSWWDSASQSWTAAPYGNPATLAASGVAQTSWTFDFPVPASGGSYEVFASAVGTNGVADITSGQSQSTAARTTFVVDPSTAAPTATLSSTWVAPGTEVTVSGERFQAGEPVALALTGTTLATATATATGSFSATVEVPIGFDFGPAEVTATGDASGLSTAASLYITNSWSQARSTATRLGLEANDSVLAEHLQVSNSGTFLTEAWSFNSGARIATSPAIVDATAYFGNNAGRIFAVDVRTGRPIWTFKDPSRHPVVSSPAVDPSTDGGILVFGSGSGSVMALDTSNGAVQWTANLGTSAIDTSPAVAGGVVYVVALSGKVYALDEQTGGIIWQTTLGGTVHSSPAVDTTANILVVGSDSGAVRALSLLSGQLLWTATTGGAVVASPLISSGEVYVGSGNGYFYAFVESTGALKWKTEFPAPITESAALVKSISSSTAVNSPFSDNTDGYAVVVGDQNGDQAYINPRTGSRTPATYIAEEAVVGTSASAGFVVTDTAEGYVQAYKGPGHGVWSTEIPAGLQAPPTIVNGELFLAADDGMLHCYVIPGQTSV